MTSSPAPRKRSIIETALTFVVIFLALQFGLKYFFPDQFGGEPSANRPPVELTPASPSFSYGHHPVITLRNNTDQPIVIPNRCPLPPLDISFVRDGQPVEVNANEIALPCASTGTVNPGEKMDVSLEPWKYSLFSELGTYQASLRLPGQDEPAATVQFMMEEAGGITKLFRTLVTKPLLNALIFIASYVPGHELGLAIIILTVLIKLLLLIPNQHALVGQKKISELQPKIDEIRKKYKDDPKKQQEETLALWKREKVNPLQSCLPMLIQFPVLIGLFFVIRDGAVLETSRHLIYSVYADLPWTFDHHFLGLDLTKPNIYVMPALLFVLQYIQMKMSFARRKKKEDVVDAKKPKFEFNQQTAMLYGLPIMIAVFAFQFQAAVSLYWAVSTTFGIGQQWFVNRKA